MDYILDRAGTTSGWWQLMGTDIKRAWRGLGDMQAHCLHHDQQSVLETRYGKNDYQAISVAASLEIPTRRYWKERLPSKLGRSFLGDFQLHIWKERLPSKPCRSFLGVFQPYIWQERLPSKLCRSFLEFPASYMESFLRALKSYIWEERLPSEASIAPSLGISSS